MIGLYIFLVLNGGFNLSMLIGQFAKETGPDAVIVELTAFMGISCVLGLCVLLVQDLKHSLDRRTEGSSKGKVQQKVLSQIPSQAN